MRRLNALSPLANSCVANGQPTPSRQMSAHRKQTVMNEDRQRASRPATAIRALRRATNVTLNVDLVAEAKALGINVSQAAEAGVAEAVAMRRAEQWLSDNRGALQSSNEFVEKNGLPLARYRNF